MKKIICSIVLVTMLFAWMGSVAEAQTASKDAKEVKELSDKSKCDRLLKDLNNRNAMTVNQPVTWQDPGNGYYYARYTLSSQNYLTRYDVQENYTETLIKKEWDATVP